MSSVRPSTLMETWIRKSIRDLQAYHVPDASGMIKLDAMENPYHWPEELTAQWLEVMKTAELNRYPNPAADKLKNALRLSMDIPSAAGIMLGNGSDEIIQILLMALSGEERKVLSVEPGFVMYDMIATFNKMQYVGVPLNADFSLDKSAVLAAIKEHNPAIIFLAYPNNPTGNLFDRDAVLEIIQAAPGIVVIDEAYHAFAEDSFMPDVGKYEQLFVMRTVSKMGLAGLRLGLIAGDASWINEFDKIRLPYNINVLTQLSAEFALQHADVLNQQTEQICHDRELLTAALQKIPDLTVFPSQANFILFKVPQGQADAIFLSLKQQGILIKNMSKHSDALKDCLRVTVGSPAENSAFITALQSSMQ